MVNLKFRNLVVRISFSAKDDQRNISKYRFGVFTISNWFPQNEVDIATNKALQNMRLMEHLEESDDVQSVASNLSITDDVIAAFES